MIKVEHGQVSDYARLGVLAGKATAAREAVARQEARDRQVMAIQAQAATQQRTQAHQKEMAEFDAYMDNIRYQSAEAWELEKMELRSRHDFEMGEAKREMDFQNQMQREQRQQQEMDTKLKAINEAEHLSPQEKEDAVVKIKTGVTIPRRTGEKVSPLESFLKTPTQRTAPPIKSEITQVRGAETTTMVGFLKSAKGRLSPTSQASLQKIIDEGNPAKVRAAFNRIKGEVAPALKSETMKRLEKADYGRWYPTG